MARELSVPEILRPYISRELQTNQEFQSSIVRLGLWCFMVSFLGIAGWQDYYQLDWEHYALLFGLHLVWYIALLVSVVRRPAPQPARRNLGMLADLSGVTFAIYLGGEAPTPFYLFYIWIFISQGSRYGKAALKAASIGSVIAYSLVVTLLGGWEYRSLDSVFLLLILVVLPLYQYSLLRRLHEARQAAEAANRARGNFLATMTHELRTPLSGVIGMTRLLDSTRLDREQREYVESLSTSANMLQALIGDVLDLSKIDAQKLELSPGPFDVRGSVTEVAGAVANQALDKGVEVIVDVAAEVPAELYGDDLRFRQVLFNLVGNAVKFTERGHVLIKASLGEPRAELRKRHLEVVVVDTGIGIPQAQLGRLFDNFWQGDPAGTRRYSGSGLGMAIARDLTGLMGGDIAVSSSEGCGTTFRVCLPFLDPALDSSPPRPPEALRGRAALLFDASPACLEILERGCRSAGMQHIPVGEADKLTRAVADHAGELDLVVLADTPRGLDLEGLSLLVERVQGAAVPTVFLHYPRRPVAARAADAVAVAKPCVVTALWDAMAQVAAGRPRLGPAQPALPDAAPGGQGARVLVAEDDSINARLVQSLLRKAGHQVVLVRNGRQALDEALNGAFDLALVDLRMPTMDGLEFARSYRARERDGHLPIVALTANAVEDARAECLAAGMDDFLTKPVAPERLDRLLRQLPGRPTPGLHG